MNATPEQIQGMLEIIEDNIEIACEILDRLVDDDADDEEIATTAKQLVAMRRRKAFYTSVLESYEKGTIQ